MEQVTKKLAELPEEGVMKTIPRGRDLMHKLINDCAADKAEKEEKQRATDATVASLPLAIKAALSADVQELERLVKDGAVDLDEPARGEDGGWRALHIACRRGPAHFVEALVAARASLDSRIGTGSSALHVACEHGTVDCLRVLIRAGADLDCATPDGSTALHVASQVGGAECARELLRAKASVDRASSGGATPLHIACNVGKSACVEELLAARASTSVAIGGGLTPLLLACASDSPPVVRALLAASAELEPVESAGFTALSRACEKGSPKCVRLLLHAKADVNPHAAPVPLHEAAQQSDEDCVRLCLEAGATVNRNLGHHGTALFAACRAGAPACVRLLVQSAADPNIAADGGQSPLYACSLPRRTDGAHVECAVLLLDARAAVNAVEARGGATPLHAAAARGNLVLMKLLREAGGSTSARDRLGRSARDVAQQAGSGGAFEACIALLQDAPDIMGERVRVHSLTKRADLNGQVGRVVLFDAKSGRYGVKLDGGSEDSVKLLPKNMELHVEAARESEAVVIE